MSDDGEYLRLLRNKVQQIMAKSPGMERMPRLEAVPIPEGIDPVAPTASHDESAQLEAVVRWYRPVLTVTDDHFVTKSDGDEGDPRFADPNAAASKGLMDALEKHRAVLD